MKVIQLQCDVSPFIWHKVNLHSRVYWVSTFAWATIHTGRTRKLPSTTNFITAHVIPSDALKFSRIFGLYNVSTAPRYTFDFDSGCGAIFIDAPPDVEMWTNQTADSIHSIHSALHLHDKHFHPSLQVIIAVAASKYCAVSSRHIQAVCSQILTSDTEGHCKRIATWRFDLLVTRLVAWCSTRRFFENAISNDVVWRFWCAVWNSKPGQTPTPTQWPDPAKIADP